MSAGYTWMTFAEQVIFYIDYGMSGGMHKALDIAIKLDRVLQFKYIGKNEETIEEE